MPEVIEALSEESLKTYLANGELENKLEESR